MSERESAIISPSSRTIRDAMRVGVIGLIAAYLVAVPFDEVVREANPGAWSLSKIISIPILGVGTTLLFNQLGRRVLKISNVKWLLVYSGLGLVSLTWTGKPDLTRVGIFMHFVILSITMLYLCQSVRFGTAVFLLPYIAACFAAALYALLSGGMATHGRLTAGAAYNPNIFAGTLGVGLVACIIAWRGAGPIRKCFLMMTGSVLLIAVWYAQSRTVILSLLLSLAICVLWRSQPTKWLRNSRFPRRELLGAGVGFLLVPAIILTTVLLVRAADVGLDSLGRLSDLFSGDWTRATSKRDEIWVTVLKIPRGALGVGFKSFINEYYAMFGEAKAPHNLYLSTYVELGLPGLLVLCGFVLSFLRTIGKNHAHLMTIGWLAVHILLSGFGNDVMDYKYFWVGWLFCNLIVLEDSNSRVDGWGSGRPGHARRAVHR